MKNCPTCGQPILPSMGERTARQVTKIENKDQPPPTLTLQITGTETKPALTPSPRGYKTQTVIKQPDLRYRIRINIINFPRRKTTGGTLTIIPLKPETRTPISYELTEQTSVTPYDHNFTTDTKELGQITITLTTP